MKLFFILLSFILVSNVFAAELLVKAKAHYMDLFNQTKIDSMTESEKQSYEARSQIGDVIVVRPDGWKWGKEECLPNYIVIKMPDMSMEEAKKYEDTIQYSKEVTREIPMEKEMYDKLVKDGKLTAKAQVFNYAKVPTITATKTVENAKGETVTQYTVNATTNEQYLKRLRKYQIPKSVVDEIKASSISNMTVGTKEVSAFKSEIVNKSALLTEEIGG